MLTYGNLSPLTEHAQNLSNYNICYIGIFARVFDVEGWHGLGGEKAEKAKKATEFSYFRGLICLVVTFTCFLKFNTSEYSQKEIELVSNA